MSLTQQTSIRRAEHPPGSGRLLAGTQVPAAQASCTVRGFLRATVLKVLKDLCHKSVACRQVPKPWTGANLKLSEAPDLLLWSQEPGEQDTPAPIPHSSCTQSNAQRGPKSLSWIHYCQSFPVLRANAGSLGFLGVRVSQAAQTQKYAGNFFMTGRPVLELPLKT